MSTFIMFDATYLSYSNAFEILFRKNSVFLIGRELNNVFGNRLVTRYLLIETHSKRLFVESGTGTTLLPIGVLFMVITLPIVQIPVYLLSLIHI